MDPAAIALLGGYTGMSGGSLGSIFSGLGSLPWGQIGAASAIGMSGLGSGFLSYETDKKLMNKQFQYNLYLQEQAQRWQEYAYKNFHSWNTESLRNAGLNPILSATNGSALSQHSGVSSVGLPSSKFNNKLSMVDLLSLMKFNQEMKNLETSNSAMRSQVGVNESNSALSMATADKVRNEARITAAEADFWQSKEGRKIFKQIQERNAAWTTNQAVGMAVNSYSDKRDQIAEDFGKTIAGKEATAMSESANKPITKADLDRARKELEERKRSEVERKKRYKESNKLFFDSSNMFLRSSPFFR